MSKKHVTVPIFIPHLACPHRCVFCNQNSISGMSEPVKPFDIGPIVERFLSTLKSSVDTVEIAFFGGSFTAIPEEKQVEYLEAAFKEKEMGRVSGIRLSTRPDCISDRAIYLLKKYSVDTVELGVQSFSDDVLKASFRGHTSNDSCSALGLLKKHGMKYVVQLMTGLPLDTPEKSLESAGKAASFAPDGVRIYPAVVFSGTLLALMYEKKQYVPQNLEEAVGLCAEMYGFFVRKRIKVLRTGLHPVDGCCADDILAGPYHTSFGFLVKSRFRRNILEKIFNDKKTSITQKSGFDLYLPEKFTEEYIGHKRENIRYLENLYDCKIRVRIMDISEPYF